MRNEIVDTEASSGSALWSTEISDFSKRANHFWLFVNFISIHFVHKYSLTESHLTQQNISKL